MDQAWVGIDLGKEFHWAAGVDETGTELLPRRVENSGADLRLLEAGMADLGRKASWAVDMRRGQAALAVALPVSADEEVAYASGLVVTRSRQALAGEAKTDRCDAGGIAENLRLRRDLAHLVGCGGFSGRAQAPRPLSNPGADPSLRSQANRRIPGPPRSGES